MSAYPKILLIISTVLAGFCVAVGALVIGAYYYLSPGVPAATDLREIKVQIPLQVYSRDGRLIQEFGEMKRTPVAYADIPPLVVKAILAAEDEHFFEHAGIDFRGVLRAIVSELSPGGRESGGSTITQQVPRTLNVFQRAGLSSGLQRFINKFREMILAIRIEREFSKEEILELYLNTSFFGQRSYGVATASQTYFGKNLGELTVAETALLVGIPNRPNDFNPAASVERAAARRAYVLRRMRETGAIDVAQYEAALAEPISSRQYGAETELSAPYVAEMVRLEMVRRLGAAAMTAGLKVTTTVDSRLQAAANRAVHDTLVAYDERHGYRGPIARVEIPTDALVEGEQEPRDPGSLRALLENHPSVLDYESALVLAAGETDGKVFFGNHGVVDIGFDAVSWAAPFINDDATGAAPTTVADVLRPGDIVRFRTTTEGAWRLAQLPEAQGAFVSVDPFDGAIVALNGGFDFFLSNYNRATQARRQPGSSFKPFVYSAAFEHGFTPASIVTDAPPDVGYQSTLERVWRPENFGGKYYGDIRLREALQRSLNAVSIRMLQSMGVAVAVEHVHRFGFDDTAVPGNLSLALGSGGVAPVNLAAGYAAFANGGYRVTPYFIDRVTTANGELLYAPQPAICAECNTPPETPPASLDATAPELATSVTELYPPQRAAPRAISAQNAYLVADMLRDVVRVGTANRARRELGRNDLAGKTGTTNEGRDTWFVGFNPNLIGAAWVGFDEDRPLGGNEQGGVTAIPMWIDFMREALDGVQERTPARPPGIVEYRINPRTGLIASDRTVDSITEIFDIDDLPPREEDGPGELREVRDPSSTTRTVEQELFQ